MAATKNTGLTRGDKTHKKFMDKLNVLRDNVNHGYDSLKAVHKQTTDSSVRFKETVKTKSLFRFILIKRTNHCVAIMLKYITHGL